MKIVTEEEYSLLEEILKPATNEGRTSLKLTGTSFIHLYESISSRVRYNKDKEAKVKEEGKVDGIKFLSNFRDRKLSGSRRDRSGRMDGLNFLWNFLSANLADQDHRPRAQRNKLNNSPPSKGIIFINNLLKRTRRNDVISALSKEKKLPTNNLQMNSPVKTQNHNLTGMTGISFLWSFFSKQLSDSLENSIQRRNEELRRKTGQHPKKETNSDDTLHRVSTDDEDDSDAESTCSSISFVTASSTSSEENRPQGTKMDPVTSTPVVRLLGNLDSQEEYYLETPTLSTDSSDEDNILSNAILGGPDEISWQRAQNYFESLRDYHLNRAQISSLQDDSIVNLFPEN